MAAKKRTKKAAAAPAQKHVPATFVVTYHDGALRDLAGFGREALKPVLTVGDFLRQLGPRLREPHCKKVEIASKLWELRPSGGKFLARPLYARIDEHRFIVFAVGPEAMEDEPGFKRAVKRAKERAKADFGLDL